MPKVDDLLDEAARLPCRSFIHRQNEDVQQLMRRARERVQGGEKIRGAVLARVIQREFGVSIDNMTINYYLRAGCRCG